MRLPSAMIVGVAVSLHLLTLGLSPYVPDEPRPYRWALCAP